MRLQEAEGLYHPYEVFVQYDHLQHHQHVGSVLAPSPEVALQMARENFLRRERAVNIWVVAKDQIHATAYEDTDFFAQEFDRSYRRVDGYSAENARRWKRFKQRALELEDMVKD
ncbi:MAG: phenylacetic acid degradation protein [Alicyclobacillus herbarius]|uniref:phenylacetic acid degradation protein n=1 Tax=Alicyclobacillus herbarius TaxID=122960 RepID=UPI002353690C|nr:phenylacetic acid degradation protein [Alicyclobacillus herbarius]MCL6631002.1 phenylacetic acid degradation protein [Alicyclobacillus herbarius]